jgi:hypothetical protein
VGLLCVVLVTVMSVYTPAAMYRVLLRTAPWFLAYVVYLLFLVPALSGTQATGLLMKQALFVTGFLCIATYFSRVDDPSRSLRLGGIAGLLIYLAFTEFSAFVIGKSMLGAVAEFLTTGSYKALIYGFFRPVFNSLESGADLAFVASLTNSIAVSLLVLALCFRTGYRKSGLDVLGTGVMVVVLLFGLLLNSRSVVLAGIACMAFSFLFRLAAVRKVSLLELLYWCIAGLGATAALVAITMRDSSALDSILTAFTFEDNSAESRLNQFSWAFGLIEDSIFFGHGYVETDTGLPIHNLFLSSWAYTGLGGFLVVIVFYLGLLATWLRWLWMVVTIPRYWKLSVRAEWVAVLPILPLFRVWISGAGGLPAYGEWIALAVFVGLVMRNEALSARVPRGVEPMSREGTMRAVSPHGRMTLKKIVSTGKPGGQVMR